MSFLITLSVRVVRVTIINFMSTYLSVSKYVAYYMHLDRVRVVNLLRYTYKGKSIVYALRCRSTGQMYIGSTTLSTLRFHNHLVTGENSNSNLQVAISRHGLSNFVAYILEVVPMSPHLSYSQQMVLLHQAEQAHINRYPKSQLYNSISASAN